VPARGLRQESQSAHGSERGRANLVVGVTQERDHLFGEAQQLQPADAVDRRADRRRTWPIVEE
jgi:hypothetical protein